MKYLIANMLIVFSGFYITKLWISPVYIMFLAVILLMLMFFRNKFVINGSVKIAIVFFMYIVMSQALLKPDIHTWLNIIMGICYFIICVTILRYIQSYEIISISNKFINMSIILLLVEAFYRIKHPIYYINLYKPVNDSLFFYPYKMNSIMYQDSNFVGIFIVVLFFFNIYLENKLHKKHNIRKMILIALCILTFSRASIITLAICYLLFIIYGSKSVAFVIKYFIIILISIGYCILFIRYGGFLSAGSSLESKFSILQRTVYYFENASISNDLFGIGLGNAANYLGIGSHNIIVTYIVETGVVGLSLFLMLWISILYKTKFAASIVMIPFLVNGMSLAGHAIPYLYSIYAIIMYLEKSEGDIKYV